MSNSFNDLISRVQTLTEAKVSPYAAAHQSFGGVTKQMREGGLSSAPLDTIKFIREILFNLDVISEEELQAVKGAKGFTGKKQAMLSVLKNNQEAINAKTDEITQTVESSLDDFISGMGVNRSREEKYAAQAAAAEMAAEIRKAKSGKELDDALVDIVSDEKLLVKVNIATAIQYLEDLPAGEDLSPEVINNIKDFAKKINTIEQFESFVKQMGAMEEYQIPAYHLSGTVKALKGGLEDVAMEDQEDPDTAHKEAGEGKYDDHDGEEERCDYVPCEDGEGDLAEMYRKDMLAEIDKMHKSMVNDGIDPTTGSEFSEAEISDLYRQAAERNLSKFKRLNKHSNGKQQDRVDVAQSILDDVNKTQAANVAPRENEEVDAEELTLESVYDTMGFIKAPVINEHGNTNQECATQQYLTEATERQVEEAINYTDGYLTEQKTSDSYIKSKPEQGQTFQERFKPTTSRQLEELRRYGL